ncbi:hypothetical protein [Xanthobacter sediminis]|uniref:hypothetical protein n=1 Tax=Xanthobacter sediminis TaxID=3119926 RepID=UPI00372AB5F2
MTMIGKLAPRVAALGALVALVLPAGTALALDPLPKTYREKQEHQFRDAQLGLSHPAPHGRSTPANAASGGGVDGNRESGSAPAQGGQPVAGQPAREGAAR